MIPCLVFAVFGLVLGSFLNVCIARLPLGESVIRPRSHCRRCGQPVAAWDNIPLLSWVVLGGKCRACGGRISWTYPAFETTTCVLFVMCCLQFPAMEAAGWALLCFLLTGLAVMDAQTLLLPDLFTLPGLLAGLIFSGLRSGMEQDVGGDAGFWQAAARAVGWALLNATIAAAVLLLTAGFYWLARRRMGMGMGDVKLLAMLAAWLGLAQTGLVLFLAVIAGALYGVGLLLARQGKSSGGKSSGPAGELKVPFGTMLSVAGIYCIFLGERTLRWYLQFFH